MQSTTSIDCDSKVIQEKSRILTQGQKDIIERARSLFYFTRDEVRYNPYASLYPIEASGTLDRGYGFCIQKAALLAALARAAGIPARLGFIDIRNHHLDSDWQKILGTNVIVYHGFAELNINGKWLKATPAFDLRMCRENGFLPVEFDGHHHGMLHSHTQDGNRHIDYLEPHGSYDDVPLNAIIEGVTRAYGPQFLECWRTGIWDHYLNS